MVTYNADKSEPIFDAWSDWITDNERDESMLKFTKKFGLIPKFARAYEVTYNDSTSCLECSCGHWNRFRIPCRHLACVVNENTELSELYKDGFPMSSVSVRWMNDYYYYGVQKDNISKCKLKDAMRKLFLKDSLGLYCPRNIKGDASYYPNQKVVDLFNAPAKYRILNYSKQQMEKIIPTDEVHFDAIYQKTCMKRGIAVNHSVLQTVIYLK